MRFPARTRITLTIAVAVAGVTVTAFVFGSPHGPQRSPGGQSAGRVVVGTAPGGLASASPTPAPSSPGTSPASPARPSSAGPDSSSTVTRTSCLAAGCDGLSSVTEHCETDAYSPTSTSMTTDYKTSSGTAAVETVRLELRYSPGCKSAWAMISSSARVSTGLEFWVYNVMTGNEEVGMFGTQFQRTTMTDDQDAASHACTYVYNSSFNEQKICTTYF